MATGWAGDSAVQDQIDATIADAIARARRQLRSGPGLARCEECDALIPELRRRAVPGVRLCQACQEQADHEHNTHSGYNRRLGSVPVSVTPAPGSVSVRGKERGEKFADCK